MEREVLDSVLLLQFGYSNVEQTNERRNFVHEQRRLLPPGMAACEAEEVNVSTKTVVLSGLNFMNSCEQN